QSVDPDPAAANFKNDLGPLPLVHQAYTPQQQFVAQLSDKEEILRRRICRGDQVRSIDVHLAVAQRFGRKLLDGSAGGLGKKELLGGGARRVGDADGGAAAAEPKDSGQQTEGRPASNGHSSPPRSAIWEVNRSRCPD